MMQAEEARVCSPTPDLAIPSRRATQPRQRYRGSISISRYGHVSAIVTATPTHSWPTNIPTQIEEYTQQASSSIPQTPTAFVEGMTTFAPFYHSQSYVCPSFSARGHVLRVDVFVMQSDSADSLSSVDDTESEHVTQVHRIAGRLSLPRSVGGMLQRTLSRPPCLPSRAADTNVVIGVVVEENHVEELEPREATPRPASHAKAYVHAPCTLRSQSSRMTIPGAGGRDTTGSWRSKAQELFKRKTRPRGSSLWTVTPAKQP